MKILIIMPWIKQGGAELTAVQTAYQLQKRGHQVKLATLFVETRRMSPMAQKISYVLPFRWISALSRRSKIFLYLAGPFILSWLILKKTKWADILFPQSLPSYWMAPIVGKFYRKKVVWLCHEPPRRREIGEVGFLDWLMWLMADSFLERLFVRGIGKIIVCSNAVKEKVKQRYERKATLLRLGIEFKFFSKKDKKGVLELKRKYRLEDKFILLMVGKLHPQKNQRLGIKVLAKILPQIKNTILVLVGEGADEENLKLKIKNLKLEKRVVFAGFCSREELRDWYSLCDLVLFPAVEQSWGLVPFEALCQRKISLVSDSCGAAEVLAKEKIGIICRPNVDAFSQAVFSVFQKKKKYEKMGERGYDYVKNNFSWEKWGRKIERILG